MWYAAAAKSLQLCLALCDPTDSSPPGSSVHRTLYAGTLEWAAMSFSVVVACGILIPQPGIEPTSPTLEGRFPAAGPPGKCPGLRLNIQDIKIKHL